jgi:hypothetical protein
MGNSPHTVSVHILDDDLLLNIFYLYRPPFLTEARALQSVPQKGKDGTGNDGGTNSHTFAKDGGTSSSNRHPTSIFASSVRLARPLQTCIMMKAKNTEKRDDPQSSGLGLDWKL